MCLLNSLKPEGSLDRLGDLSGPKPLKRATQIRHEVLRRAAEAEERHGNAIADFESSAAVILDALLAEDVVTRCEWASL